MPLDCETSCGCTTWRRIRICDSARRLVSRLISSLLERNSMQRDLVGQGETVRSLVSSKTTAFCQMRSSSQPQTTSSLTTINSRVSEPIFTPSAPDRRVLSMPRMWWKDSTIMVIIGQWRNQNGHSSGGTIEDRALGGYWSFVKNYLFKKKCE